MTDFGLGILDFGLETGVAGFSRVPGLFLLGSQLQRRVPGR